MPDVNGSDFHLLTGARDWDPLASLSAGVVFDPDAPGITLAPRLFRFPDRAAADAPSLADRRGAARDCYGNIFVIGPDERSILIHPAGVTEFGHYWPPVHNDCPPDPDALFKPVADATPAGIPRLTGLTITTLNYLVGGTVEPGGFYILDLHGGGPAEQLVWPDTIPLSPFDMFPTPDGGLWVLDRDNLRSWRLNRWFFPEDGPLAEIAPAATDAFKPVGGDPVSRPPLAFPTGFALNRPGFDARAIIGLGDDTVLILGFDAGDDVSTLLRYRGETLLDAVPLDPSVLGGLLPDSSGLSALDMALVADTPQPGGRRAGTLRLMAADGNQAFDLRFDADAAAEGGALTLRLAPLYYPVRGFTGRGLVEAGSDTLYDLDTRWVPLTAQPRGRYLREGALDGIIIDSGVPDMVWHRIALDACMPDGTSVDIEARTADAEEELPLSDWRAQPRPHLRGDGADLPFHTPFPTDAQARAGVWDTLLQQQTGRWIELRLTLRGKGTASPLIRAMRVWKPRFSYLQEYLPAIYRADPDAADFLDRWLANFEGVLTSMEGRVAGAERYFDTRTVPDEALDWLGDWLGVVPGRLSDPQRQRLLISHAPLLWDWRGTPLGLLTLLRLALDPCVDDSLFDPLKAGACCAPDSPDIPRLIETFLSRDFAPAALGDPSVLDQPTLVSRDAVYDPTRGPGPLNAAYRAFLQARYGTTAALEAAWNRPVGAIAWLDFPALRPQVDGAESSDWDDAARGAFDFLYSDVGAGDAALWQSFLARRYADTDALNAAWGLLGTARLGGFAAATLPDTLPANRTTLADWLDFVTRLIPVHRAAHRFSVLLPAIPGETPDQMALRAGIAQTVIARERPAHTSFDVRFFWSLFQVGSARLGTDTIVGEGARFNAIVLDRTALGAGYLSQSHPWSVRARAVVGRIPVLEA